MSAKSNPESSINELLAQLDELVTWFNQDDVDVEAALAKYEEATKLAEQIKKRLHEVDNKITVLKQRFESDS